MNRTSPYTYVPVTQPARRTSRFLRALVRITFKWLVVLFFMVLGAMLLGVLGMALGLMTGLAAVGVYDHARVRPGPYRYRRTYYAMRYNRPARQSNPNHPYGA